MSYRLLIIGLYSAGLVAQVSSPTVQQNKPASSIAATAAGQEQRGFDPLLDLPPLPKSEVTLIGGTLVRVDRVRDRILVKPFGGHEVNIAFDLRTRISRDQATIGAQELPPGSRVYVDTLFDGSRIFAKNIQVRSQGNCGDARGQVAAYDASREVLDLREEMLSRPLPIKITPQTLVRINERSAAASDIPIGALVAISFAAGTDDRPFACDIRVLAVPGQVFTFYGAITFVDLSSRRIAITNRSDETNYDISMDSMSSANIKWVREGVAATLKAVFDGQHYEAKEIEISTPKSAQEQQ